MGNIYGGRSFSPSSMEIRKGNPQNAPCLKHTATERIRNIRPGRPAAGASPFYAAPGCFYHNIMQRSLQLLFTALRPFCHSGSRPASGLIPASDRIPCLTAPRPGQLHCLAAPLPERIPFPLRLPAAAPIRHPGSPSTSPSGQNARASFPSQSRGSRMLISSTVPENPS